MFSSSSDVGLGLSSLGHTCYFC